MYICSSMRYLYILLLWVLCWNNSWSQDKGSYQDKMAAGNKLLAKKDYAGALTSFMAAYNADSSSGNAAYKTGLCLFNIGGKEADAAKYLEKASKKASKQYDANNVAEKAS